LNKSPSGKPGAIHYDYNNVRPHSSLGNKTPIEARRAFELSEDDAPDNLATSETEDYQTQGLSL
jgi:putative transposase